MHKQEEEATYFCSMCDIPLCTECAHGHTQVKMFKTHTVTSYRDVSMSMMTVDVGCPKPGHDQPVSGFCADCKVLLCPTCATTDHRTHQYVCYRV